MSRLFSKEELYHDWLNDVWKYLDFNSMLVVNQVSDSHKMAIKNSVIAKLQDEIKLELTLGGVYIDQRYIYTNKVEMVDCSEPTMKCTFELDLIDINRSIEYIPVNNYIVITSQLYVDNWNSKKRTIFTSKWLKRLMSKKDGIHHYKKNGIHIIYLVEEYIDNIAIDVNLTNGIGEEPVIEQYKELSFLTMRITAQYVLRPNTELSFEYKEIKANNTFLLTTWIQLINKSVAFETLHAIVIITMQFFFIITMYFVHYFTNTSIRTIIAFKRWFVLFIKILVWYLGLLQYIVLTHLLTFSVIQISQFTLRYFLKNT